MLIKTLNHNNIKQKKRLYKDKAAFRFKIKIPPNFYVM